MKTMKHYIHFAVFLVNLSVLCLSHESQKDAAMVANSFHIDCKITSRFARTKITTEVYNQLNISREAIFHVELPKTAFITNFSMTVEGVTHVGTVKEHAKAKMQYSKAVSRGQSAGLVQSTGRKMEQFKISVNVAGFSNATFKLVYEELLKRYLGKYEYNLKVRPKQLVKSFQINVDIIEPQGISFLKTDATFINNELTDILKTDLTENKARIEFKPTLDQQRTCPHCSDTVLDGDFVLKYDVNRDVSAGNIQIINGYFVHYFAPKSLKNVPKNVVFVIDRSGSMYGRKIKQTIIALDKILDDIPEEDHFGILTFDSEINHWKEDLVKATKTHINEAKDFVKKITAEGSTDINEALLAAEKMLRNATEKKLLPEISTSIIILLSDGDPTDGVTDLNTIVKNVKQAIQSKATLYCLGFGEDLDYDFLEKLSQENGGLARRIYEDSDAALQLQGFYNEVAYPVLLDVHLEYLDNSVEHLTKNRFRHSYQGSEIIVAGHIGNNNLEILTAQVTAQGASEKFSVNLEKNITDEDCTLREQGYIFGDFTERLWSYLTIEQLLNEEISAEGEEKNNLRERALNLSLKYNFVTPLTSMVVTTSEDEDKKIVANKPKEKGHEILYDDDSVEYRRINVFGMGIIYDDDIVGHGIVGGVGYLTSGIGPARDIVAKPATFVKVQEPTVIPFEAEVIFHTKTQQTPFTDCKNNHVVLRVPLVEKSICLQIDVEKTTIINLLHIEHEAFTFNGEVSQNRTSFERFGLIKNKLEVEITLDNITLKNEKDEREFHEWTSSFEKEGFMKTEGKKMTVLVENGTTLIISMMENPHRLALFVEQKDTLLNGTTGLLGQLINQFIQATNTFPVVRKKEGLVVAERGRHCEFTPHDLDPDRECWFVNINQDELTSGTGNIISDIYKVPHAMSHQ
ncbi:inter-alpha-trypsin inhibitor heavy chain H3-like isoform X2 [Spea bombifrons]|uniref:inter-alpha-trypsin inhibitor heavy chain H3-like isoform X2 n=1 Tax=Spea bombifrons TaxID=233779 RepID=UPI00234A113B|nr:inter-alpha-trypsin inhibitor heavy chain H3-like isoform X2 [Spea bombifrons]